jgi:hypothetical protein
VERYCFEIVLLRVKEAEYNGIILGITDMESIYKKYSLMVKLILEVQLLN